MRKLILLALGVLAALITGCPAEPDTTTVVVDRDQDPAASHTTIIEDSDPPATAPETNVDVDVTTEDKTPDEGGT
ncbi:MAG: hypothetical protein M3R04_04775 [bacterium]|nr:hypothetical protein [bacterium]